MRETPGTAWNQYVNRLTPISLREFARLHNVPYETWRREFNRGAVSPVTRHSMRVTDPKSLYVYFVTIPSAPVVETGRLCAL